MGRYGILQLTQCIITYLSHKYISIKPHLLNIRVYILGMVKKKKKKGAPPTHILSYTENIMSAIKHINISSISEATTLP